MHQCVGCLRSAQCPSPEAIIQQECAKTQRWDIQPEFKKQAFEILSSVRDRQPRIFANNLTEMSKVVNDLYIIQLIKASEFEEFSHLAGLHKNAKGDTKKPRTDQIAQMYGDLLYYKYIAKPHVIIRATTKTHAKPPSRAAGSGEN